MSIDIKTLIRKFIGLKDTPSSYVGSAGLFAKVNAGETALEFGVAGGGDVVGPAGAVDNKIVLFDGATGKLIKDSGVDLPAGALIDTNDARLSDARTPTAHAATHVTGGGDTVADAIAAGNSGLMSGADKTKLDGIEALADVTNATNIASSIVGVADKTTPVDADSLGLIDSAAANVLKELTWVNVKATLKTYLDTLYSTLSHASRHVTGGGDTVADAIAAGNSGLMSGADKTKLDGIEALADVTDAANVAAAGAVMAEIASIWLPAEAAYLPVTNPAALSEVAGATVYAGWSVLAFDDTTSEHAVWRVPVPDYDGGNITVTGFTKVAATPAGAVTLQFDILTIGLATSEAFDAAATADTGVNLSFSLNATELLTDVMIANAVIDPANVAADDLLVIELARDVATDDLAGDGQLLGILLEYTKV